MPRRPTSTHPTQGAEAGGVQEHLLGGAAGGAGEQDEVAEREAERREEFNEYSYLRLETYCDSVFCIVGECGEVMNGGGGCVCVSIGLPACRRLGSRSRRRTRAHVPRSVAAACACTFGLGCTALFSHASPPSRHRGAIAHACGTCMPLAADMQSDRVGPPFTPCLPACSPLPSSALVSCSVAQP